MNSFQALEIKTKIKIARDEFLKLLFLFSRELVDGDWNFNNWFISSHSRGLFFWSYCCGFDVSLSLYALSSAISFVIFLSLFLMFLYFSSWIISKKSSSLISASSYFYYSLRLFSSFFFFSQHFFCFFLRLFLFLFIFLFTFLNGFLQGVIVALIFLLVFPQNFPNHRFCCYFSS